VNDEEDQPLEEVLAAYERGVKGKTMNLYKAIAEHLAKGTESVTFCPQGGSMTPRIKSGQEITVHRLKADDELEIGDVVLARVHGQYYLHKIIGIDDHRNRLCIGNNHGGVNGWTTREKVYGKAEA
jgi:hypothetical protein